MGTGKKWGDDFTPQAFKGTQDRPGLTAGQNDAILNALGGPAPVSDPGPARRVAQEAPRRPPAAETARTVTPDPPRATPRVDPVRSAQRVEPSQPQANPSPRPDPAVGALRRQLQEAKEGAQASEERANEEHDARLRAERAVQQARDELKRAKTTPAAAPKKPAPPRGAVHAKLTPKLMRFPPLLLDRLAALALAYGLDQTSTVRLALTELYERAVSAGTVSVTDT